MQTLTHSNSDDFLPSMQSLLSNPKLRHLVAHAQWLGQLTQALHQTLEDPQLAQHCVIADFKRGRLVVMVDSAAWLTRLNFTLPELERRLQGHPLLSGLCAIVVQIQPSSAVPPTVVRPKPKLSLKNADLLRQTASHIRDEKLRKALEKLAQNTA